MPKTDYQLLDAVLIIGCVLISAGIIMALVFVAIPQSQLPIISGLGGTVLGIITTYAAFRWQIQNQKKPDAPVSSVAVDSSSAQSITVTPATGGQDGTAGQS